MAHDSIGDKREAAADISWPSVDGGLDAELRNRKLWRPGRIKARRGLVERLTEIAVIGGPPEQLFRWDLCNVAHHVIVCACMPNIVGITHTTRDTNLKVTRRWTWSLAICTDPGETRTAYLASRVAVNPRTDTSPETLRAPVNGASIVVADATSFRYFRNRDAQPNHIPTPRVSTSLSETQGQLAAFTIAQGLLKFCTPLNLDGQRMFTPEQPS